MLYRTPALRLTCLLYITHTSKEGHLTVHNLQEPSAFGNFYKKPAQSHKKNFNDLNKTNVIFPFLIYRNDVLIFKIRF